MSTAHTAARSAADPTLRIPPPPRLARRPSRTSGPTITQARLLDALREASLVGMATLALCWGLAELVMVLLGAD
jgi:hypothetical protein